MASGHPHHEVTASHGASDKNSVLFAFETVTQCGLRDIKLITDNSALTVFACCLILIRFCVIKMMEKLCPSSLWCLLLNRVPKMCHHFNSSCKSKEWSAELMTTQLYEYTLNLHVKGSVPRQSRKSCEGRALLCDFLSPPRQRPLMDSVKVLVPFLFHTPGFSSSNIHHPPSVFPAPPLFPELGIGSW